jgi:hypothetical protein
VKRQRVAAQIAQEKIEIIAHEHTVKVENEADTDRFTRNSVGELFQFSESTRKNLPSEEASFNASVHLDESQRGRTAWSCLVQMPNCFILVLPLFFSSRLRQGF